MRLFFTHRAQPVTSPEHLSLRFLHSSHAACRLEDSLLSVAAEAGTFWSLFAKTLAIGYDPYRSSRPTASITAYTASSPPEQEGERAVYRGTGAVNWWEASMSTLTLASALRLTSILSQRSGEPKNYCGSCDTPFSTIVCSCSIPLLIHRDGGV